MNKPLQWAAARRVASLLAALLLSALSGASTLAIAQKAQAQDSEIHEADAAVRRTIEQGLEVLRNPKWQGPDKRSSRMSELRRLIDPVFDWDEMSKRSLGVHWRGLDETQRKRFVAVFSDLLADHYMNDIDRFRGTEQVRFEGGELQGDDRNVKTTLVTHSGELVPIHYVMHKTSAGWRCWDVSIEGVSLVNHYRKGFNRQLANKAFPELLAQLEQKRGPAAPSSPAPPK